MRFFIPQIYKEDFTLPNHMTKDINKRNPLQHKVIGGEIKLNKSTQEVRYGKFGLKNSLGYLYKYKKM